VNYDRFDISPEWIDRYADMVKCLADRFYSEVTRYTSSTFLRAKLNEALKKHSVDPKIYDTLMDARDHLDVSK
jgi:propionate CoA-transferase